MALAQAAVEIIADTSGVGDELVDKLRKLGSKAGTAFSRAFASNTRVSAANFSGVGKAASSAGSTAGAAYAKSFTRTVGPALESSPLSGAFSGFAERARAAGSRAAWLFSQAFSSSITLSDTQGVDFDFLSSGAAPAGERAGVNYSRALRNGLSSALSGIGSVVRGALSNIGQLAQASLSGLSSAFRSAGKAATSSAAAFAAGGVALAGIAAIAAQLAAELSATIGILAAAPAAILGMKAATATLKVALQGVGQAFSAALSGGAKQFQQALQGLAPAARQTARDLRTLRPALQGLQSAVQQSFFKPLVGQLQSLSSVITGPLQSGMTKLAGLFGQAAAQVVQFLSSAQATRTINAIFTAMSQSVKALGPALGQVLTGFTALARVGASSLPKIAGAIARVAGAFGRWMQQIAKSGQATTWIRRAMVTFGKLGSIVKNLVGTFVAFSTAVTGSGTSILSMLVRMTAAMRKWVASAKGQRTIIAIFNLLKIAAKVLMVPLRLLGMIFRTVILPAVRAVMPILRRLAAAVFPMLRKAIKLVQPIFVQLGKSFRSVLRAILPVVNQIINFLAPAFQKLVPIVKSAVSLVVDVIKNLFAMIKHVFQLIGAVMRGDWSAAWDAIKGIVKNGIDLVMGLIRNIPDLIMTALGNLGSLLFGIGKDIIQGLWDGLKAMWDTVKGWLGNIGKWIQSVKGPPSYDRTILIPAGQAIMQGLDKGLRSGYRDVQRTLRGMTTDIGNTQVPVSMSAPGRRSTRAVGAPGAAAGGATGGTTTVHAPITVQTAATSPDIVARKTAHRVARMAQA